MWSQGNSASASRGLFPQWARATIGPLALMALTLPLASLLVSASASHGGSLLALLRALAAAPLPTLRAALLLPTPGTLQVLAAFCAWQLALVRLVPGARYNGPPTATGHVPTYHNNGLVCFALTVGAYFLLSTWGLGARVLPLALQFSPAVLAVEYARMVSFLSIAALGVSLALTVKGLTCPSTRDAGSSGNVVMDLFWGTELYPRVLGWDVKQFTNCRFGMMLWGLLPLAFAAQGMEAAGASLPSRAVAVNAALQLVYVSKFFLWESGYMQSLDIMHDRVGYYLAWGCMVWCVGRRKGRRSLFHPNNPPPSPHARTHRIPSVYVSHSYFLAAAGRQQQPGADLSPAVAAALLALGLLAIYVNWAADEQRAHVRRAHPHALVWGAKPTVILAKYSSGKATKTSILLASGWWGVARHFHYVPEVLASVAWSAPAALVGGGNVLVPFFYSAFLTVLLLDRAYRDDARCAEKYGESWAKYKKMVPYRVIPYVL
jgi:7-dehydrocholesterol reductase